MPSLLYTYPLKLQDLWHINTRRLCVGAPENTNNLSDIKDFHFHNPDVQDVEYLEQAFKRKIDFAILFTRMPAAIVSKKFSDIARQFLDSEIPVLEAQLIEREAFKTMFSMGRVLYDLPEHTNGLQKAQHDSYGLADAVVSHTAIQHLNRFAQMSVSAHLGVIGNQNRHRSQTNAGL